MKTRFYGSTAGAIVALAFAGSAFANQITVNTSAGNGEPDLYQIANNPIDGRPALFTDLTPSSPQVDNAYWANGANGSTSAVLQATWTSNYSNATFGVYNVNNPNERLNLLLSGSVKGNNSSVGTRVKGFLSYDIPTGMFTASIQNTTLLPNDPNRFLYFDQKNFGANIFGYFLTIGNNTYFSDSSLNGGKDRVVAYEGDKSGSLLLNEYLFGWEDGTDNDYQDYVATVESVRPVPEPSSIAMFGVGLLMIGFAARRLQKRDV